MKMKKRLLALFLLPVQIYPAVADDAVTVDTSNWKCKYCLFEEEGFSGVVDAGLGYVSDDSYKFGEYTGLKESGVYLLGDADLRVRGEEANYWDIYITNIGLDSRSINVEGGKQGSYKLEFSYDELPHYISNSVSTPFLGSGSNDLTLPPGWVRAPTTDTMTELQNSLRNETLETKRKRLGLAATIISSNNWQHSVSFRNETRQGKQSVSGSFLFNSVQMIMPVDYTTRQIDLSTSYTRQGIQARFAYYGSLFSEGNDALNWENPYSSATGVDNGQLALPPDNEFHQLSASVGYDFGQKTRATADIAIGRMTQNQAFLAPTVNTSLAGYPFALPRNSLDGQVDTLNLNAKVATSFTPKLRMSVDFRYDDEDDKTPQADFTWVTTDSTVNATTRRNLPYSFTRSNLKLDADYQLFQKTRISAGVDREKFDRTYQEVSSSTEDTLWARARSRIPGDIDLTLKLSHAERSIDNYETLPWLDTPENVLLRKYNMADRDRDQGNLRVEFLGIDKVTIGLGVNYAKDDYSKSVIGLTESEDTTYSADASLVLGQQTSLYGFLNHQTINAMQVGSSSGATPDWTGKNKDTVNTIGIGLKHSLVEDKLTLGADYTRSDSSGKVEVITGVNQPGFPENKADLQRIKIYAMYKLLDNLSINGTYWYEKLDSADWSIDGVAADTISNVLALGDQSPNYDISVYMLSLRYSF